MKLSNLNDYLQTLATVGAIAGLLILAYEVRQSNALALSQNQSAIWTNWLENSNAKIDSGIARTIAMSMSRAEELTLEDKINLGFYYESWINAYVHDVNSIYFLNLGNFEQAMSLIASEIMDEAPKVFGSRFSRAWLEKNRQWIQPQFLEIVDAALENAPIGSDLAHWQSIDELAATME